MYKESRNATPFSLRLTFEERQQLDNAAGNMPLGAYIREQLIDAPSPRKREFKRPVQNEKLLAQLLAELGSQRLSNNLNQLAKASHKNTLLANPENQENIQNAVQNIEDIKTHIIDALGLNMRADL